MPRARLVWGTALVAVVVAVAVGVFLVVRPTADVADPGPSATPEQVVRAYVDAVNARDFATANRIAGVEHMRYSRFDRAGRFDDLTITGADRITRASDGSRSSGDDYAQAWHVRFTARQSGHDISMGPEGTIQWGYVVVRNSGAQPWRIIDAGHA
ncbi:hypothetical protein [Knoellia koreensis]|uniref:DUF4829 domain-containing protein n=1 Tax=Knoellia koreensis TaxID=2730921 RepID=A0A849HA39_9MICO|nr:hypothetical protein [Knoellia sp. DB2414S]NNM46596.1 hypothetical protein [Knoellia sp. DB2414S]